jgi:hypothetical protein
MLYRILLLTTDRSDTHQDIHNFDSCLRNCGYARHQLLPLFQAAHKKITRRLRLPAPDITPPKNNKNCIFFHVPYNSLDPDRRHTQNLFRTCILEPNGAESLLYLRNHSDCYCDITRLLVVAYHKQRNLKNLLFPRRFREIINHPVSSFFPPLDNAPQEQP